MTIWKTLYVMAATICSAVIALYVRRGRTAVFDLKITTAIQRRKHPLFRRVMLLASWAGFPPQSRLLPPALAAFWLVIGRPREAVFQLAGWGTSGISGTLKFLMRRPRPHIDNCIVIPARIGGTSFPSGHVINYTGIYGTFAVLAASRVRYPFLRRAALGAVATKLALVGPSRIYMGHHWFTDVVTSYLLGSSYVIVLSSIYRRVAGR